jgi:hypothetical protein
MDIDDIERMASEAHELIYGCSIENASEASAERPGDD